MLKGVHPLLHADLLHALASMGHGDELVIADANFPAASIARRLIQASGASAPDALDAILTVFPLDTFLRPAALTMQIVGDDQLVTVAHRRQCMQQIGVQQRMDPFQHTINP